MKEIGVDFNMLEDFYTLPGLQEHASESLCVGERVLCVDFGGDPEDIYIGRVTEIHDDGLVRIKMEWPKGLEEFYYWNEQRMIEALAHGEPVETTGPSAALNFAYDPARGIRIADMTSGNFTNCRFISPPSLTD